MRKLIFVQGLLTLLTVLLVPFGIAGARPSARNAPGSAGTRNPFKPQQASKPDVRQLEPGASVERELAAGGEHNYKIVLDAKHFVSFQIEKHGITVAVTLKDPTGKTVFSGALEAREQGAEIRLLVTEVSGPHTLTIEPVFNEAPLGRYQLRVEQQRDLADEERQRFTAQQMIFEADRLANQFNPDGWRQSINELKKSIEIWQALDDKLGEARTLTRLGQNSFWLADYETALNDFKRAAELRHAVGDATGEAEAVRWSGMVYVLKSDFQTALKYLDQALELQKALAERWQLASTYMELGKAHLRLGSRDKTLIEFNAALQGFQAVGDIRQEAGSRLALSYLATSEGDYQTALNNLHPVLELFRSLGLKYEEASTLINLGSVYFNLGALQEALGFFIQSRALFSEMDPRGEAHALTNMGIIYATLGQTETALNTFNDALDRMRKFSDPLGEAIVLNHIGRRFLERPDFPEALQKFNQSWEIARKLKNPTAESHAHQALGDTFAAMGDEKKAIEHLNKALEMMRILGNRHGESQVLYALARIARNQSRLLEGRQYLNDAINIIESLRAKVAGTELRISYLAGYQKTYKLYIDTLMLLHEQSPKLGYGALALQVSEKARARVLLESLSESRANISRGVDRKLLERERLTQQKLNAKVVEKFRLPPPPHTPEQMAQAARTEREITALVDEFRQVQAQIRASSPRYASLTQSQPLELKEIQAQLDAETLLLVYSLGEPRSYLFAVTATTVNSYALPTREVIETAADRAYQSVVKRDLTRVVNDQGKPAFTNSGVKDRQLLSQLLLGPVAAQLPGKRLAIVADGKLQFVPFPALPAPDGGNKPLVAEHEIVNLPSISVLAQQRHELIGRAKAPMSIALIGDPVYESGDARLTALANKSGPGRVRPGRHSPEQKQPSAPANEAGHRHLAPSSSRYARGAVRRSGEEGEPETYKRLPSSRDEVKLITDLVAPSTYLKLLDFEASRANILSSDLSRFRILHFATHAKLDLEHPEVSGIVLSLYEKTGREQDGFLRSHELYNLQLNADLVVLSACQTALGKQVKGEGLMSLARGFMYAGAPRVVVSLWKVEDSATAELMTHFYRGMFRKKLTPAKALRAAQVAMAQKQTRWSAPHYWAGFVLQGDWR